jgi:hypothetical protein
MAKLLPSRRRIVRGIASCGIVLAVLVQALAFLLAETARPAPQGEVALVVASAELCRATAGGGHAPPSEGHSCALCILCECERTSASLAAAPLRSATTAPLRLAAALPAPRAEDAPPPAGIAASWSSRAPPRA